MTGVPNRWKGLLLSLGPGLLWAGAAIGVSHLVQSTRAGAAYGFTLVWAIIVANLFKYPFFEFGPRYAAATGESLLEGYKRLGTWVLYLFLGLTFLTMFTILAAVTLVTAAVTTQIITSSLPLWTWSALLLAFSMAVLLLGHFSFLDRVMKFIIVILSLSTLAAALAAWKAYQGIPQGSTTPSVWNIEGITFLVALMGWMPSAIDISVWHSIWTLERRKETHHAPTLRESLFDFNLGYIVTAVLALAFLSLGAFMMHGRGEAFSTSGVAFAKQFIGLYTQSLSQSLWMVVVIAAFTTMFSTTLTCLDAFPRVLQRSTSLIRGGQDRPGGPYWAWMLFVGAGAVTLLAGLQKSLTVMVDIATTLSFLTAPILGYINYRVVTGSHMPSGTTPPPWLRVLSWIGLVFLTGFAILFLVWRFGGGGK